MEKLEPKTIENILALTPLQEGLLFHYLKEPRSGLYFEQLSPGISGEIDVKLFEDAWNGVIETNEMMCPVFRWEKFALDAIKASDRGEGFDLNRVPVRIISGKLEEKRRRSAR
jgi:hypothetical protein